ncbi:hypothetical protein CJJ07_002799 [Candidozyma auris]|nr:hypothetical protein CJJ07_002799 [[Candida] auris]QEL62452.1 hypothetical protein CJJ09_004628 [[Candida] auris]
MSLGPISKNGVIEKNYFTCFAVSTNKSVKTALQKLVTCEGAVEGRTTDSIELESISCSFPETSDAEKSVDSASCNSRSVRDDAIEKAIDDVGYSGAKDTLNGGDGIEKIHNRNNDSSSVDDSVLASISGNNMSGTIPTCPILYDNYPNRRNTGTLLIGNSYHIRRVTLILRCLVPLLALTSFLVGCICLYLRLVPQANCLTLCFSGTGLGSVSTGFFSYPEPQDAPCQWSSKAIRRFQWFLGVLGVLAWICSFVPFLLASDGLSHLWTSCLCALASTSFSGVYGSRAWTSEEHLKLPLVTQDLAAPDSLPSGQADCNLWPFLHPPA